MEEKKLTDEEIVKALDFCTVYEDCEECEYDDIAGCRSFLMRNALELIHRLKNENESLKKQIEELSKPRKKILANKVYSDSTLKKWKKEDLIEHIRILEHNWLCAEEFYNNSVKNSEKIFYEQKAEIERLTEERNEYKDLYETMYRKYADLQDKDFNCEALRKQRNEYLDKALELQKQVDKLKKELKILRHS